MGRTHDTVISNFDLDRLEAELEAERALADRLADVLELYYADDAIAHHAGIADAPTAWKEARSE